MIPATTRLAAWLLGFCILLAACAEGPVRQQGRFLRVSHAALFLAPDGDGRYLVALESTRTVPALSTLEAAFDRPGLAPWPQRVTVRGGQRRFEFLSPVIPGFDAGDRYFVRFTLTAIDGGTILDRLRQPVIATSAGAARPDPQPRSSSTR